MTLPPELKVELEAVTPLFLAGADPNDHAEIRAPSIKGLLRYWYRALDPDYGSHEADYFGSTTTGQSPCLLRIRAKPAAFTGQQQWEGWRDSNTENGRYHKPPFPQGSGKTSTNGIVYLGYSLAMRPNDRRALPAGTQFTLAVVPRPKCDTAQVRRAWLAALWALVHVGGVGSRSRRGLGSLRIKSWTGWPECSELSLPCQAADAKTFIENIQRAWSKLAEWFPAARPAPLLHTVLAPGASFLLINRHPCKGSPGAAAWEEALHQAGLHLQKYRQRRGMGNGGDYDQVKAHLAEIHKAELGIAAGVTPALLAAGPERAGFGLPLTFRYDSLKYPHPNPPASKPGKKVVPEISFAGGDHDRCASPLFIRVVQLGNCCYPLFVHLPAPLLPAGEKIKGAEADKKNVCTIPHAAGVASVVQSFINAHKGQGILWQIPAAKGVTP